MVKEYPLEGVRTYELNILPDERGFFGEALRQDWQDFIDEWIAQVNLLALARSQQRTCETGLCFI